MSISDDDFQAAADFLTSTPAAAGLNNDAKLEIYGLYKVIKSGEPDGQRPSFFNMTARAKYDAWTEQFRSHTSRDTAKERYLEIAAGLGYEKDNKTGGGSRGVRVSTMTAEVSSNISPLHDAVVADDLELVKKLLQEDNINVPDEFGNTPLHLSADRGLLDMAHLLLERGANKNAKDEDGQTPLDLAVLTGRRDLERLLKDAS